MYRKISLYIAALYLILTACNNISKDQKSIGVKKINSLDTSLMSTYKNGTLLIEFRRDLKKGKDSVTSSKDDETSYITNNKIKSSNQEEMNIPQSRFEMLPGYDHFNGEPMVQQIEIPKETFKEFPDTLSKIAVARYKTYDEYFPRAISDNFEEGISHEHVVYPKKLIFRFMLYEDEFAKENYLIKDIIVLRDKSGNPYAE